MNNTGILNSQSTYNRSETGRRAGLDLHIERRSDEITREEVESLETLIQARLGIARYHRKPTVRIQELEKQKILLATLKVTL